MTEAELIADNAKHHVLTLITEMMGGDHPDNRVLLGELLSGNRTIQIQLLVTQDARQMIDECGCPIHIDSTIFKADDE